jgi:hypothetical protein
MIPTIFILEKKQLWRLKELSGSEMLGRTDE